MAFNGKPSHRETTCLQPTLVAPDLRHGHAGLVRSSLSTAVGYSDPGSGNGLCLTTAATDKSLHQSVASLVTSSKPGGEYKTLKQHHTAPEPPPFSNLIFDQHRQIFASAGYEQPPPPPPPHHLNDQYYYPSAHHPGDNQLGNQQRGAYALLQNQHPFGLKRDQQDHQQQQQQDMVGQGQMDGYSRSAVAAAAAAAASRFPTCGVGEKGMKSTGYVCDVDDLSDDERERVRVKREKNRVAAAKCRNRRRELLERLEKEVDHLEREGEALKENVRRLQGQKQKLNTILDDHEVACVNNLDTSGDPGVRCDGTGDHGQAN